MERGRPRKRRDPKPRCVVDFTGGLVADLTLRSTPESKERTPDWKWPSINLSIHPTIKNVRTNVPTLNPVAIDKPGIKKKARGATIRRKKGVSGLDAVRGVQRRGPSRHCQRDNSAGGHHDLTSAARGSWHSTTGSHRAQLPQKLRRSINLLPLISTDTTSAVASRIYQSMYG